jgi:hypothetical protein
MSSSVYNINKGINKAIEFKGIKAQYLLYFAAGLVVLMLTFVILFISGLNVYLCIGIILTLGIFLFTKVNKYSHKYGEYGLLKEAGYRQCPPCVCCRSRNNTFLDLKPQ